MNFLWTGVNRVARALGVGGDQVPQPTVVALTEDYGFVAGRGPAPNRIFSTRITNTAANYSGVVLIPGVDVEVRIQGITGYRLGASPNEFRAYVIPDGGFTTGIPTLTGIEQFLHGDPVVRAAADPEVPPGRLGTVVGSVSSLPAETVIGAIKTPNLPAPTTGNATLDMRVLRSADDQQIEHTPVLPYPGYYFALRRGLTLWIYDTAINQSVDLVVSFHEVPTAGL